METLSPAEAHQWRAGDIDFESLLLLYPSHSHQSLAELLDLPFPAQLVSAKWKLTETWPVTDRQRIREAQVAYDAGLIELCQAKSNYHTLLLAFVRKVPARRRVWFTLGKES